MTEYESNQGPGANVTNGSTTITEEYPGDAECADFQSRMAERMAAGEDLTIYPHMRTCKRCQALIAELEAIAEAARMLMKAEEDPPEKIWSNIIIALETGEP